METTTTPQVTASITVADLDPDSWGGYIMPWELRGMEARYIDLIEKAAAEALKSRLSPYSEVEVSACLICGAKTEVRVESDDLAEHHCQNLADAIKEEVEWGIEGDAIFEGATLYLDPASGIKIEPDDLTWFRENQEPLPRPLSTPGRAPTGWTQAELASALGVSVWTVRAWERGQNPTPSRLGAVLSDLANS